MKRPLTHQELLQLKRWNTPTIYNGWEQITKHDVTATGINQEPLTDYMPEMGPMVGYAVTLKIEPSEMAHKDRNPDGWSAYRRYVGESPGPKIVVVQDVDKPRLVGAFWGEVNANVHRALGCVGTIIDGAIRDVDEMKNAGFKGLARGLCVSHAHVFPVEWSVPVDVFGTTIQPGQLIHADKHGFLAIPEGEEKGLLEASLFMDRNECNTVIAAARSTAGKSTDEILDAIDAAGEEFSRAAQEKFGQKGEW